MLLPVSSRPDLPCVCCRCRCRCRPPRRRSCLPKLVVICESQQGSPFLLVLRGYRTPEPKHHRQQDILFRRHLVGLWQPTTTITSICIDRIHCPPLRPTTLHLSSQSSGRRHPPDTATNPDPPPPIIIPLLILGADLSLAACCLPQTACPSLPGKTGKTSIFTVSPTRR